MARYVPIHLDADDAEVRCILLRQDVARDLDAGRSAIPERKVMSMNSQATAFVRGDKLTVSFPGGQASDGDMKGLRPPGGIGWQMRFREPMRYRLLGVVPERDVFLGLMLLPREGLDFSKSISRIRQIWASMQGDGKPNLIGSDRPGDAFSNWREAR